MIALAIAGTAVGAVTYEVSAVSRTTTITVPHPTELGVGPRDRRSGAQVVPVRPRRHEQAPVRVSAEVTLDGDSIRVVDYIFDRGDGAVAAPASLASVDGGVTFDITEAGTARRMPFRFVLDPTAMILRAVTAVFAPKVTGIEIDRYRVTADGTWEGRPAMRHRLRARFRATPDARMRPEPMELEIEFDVRTVNGISADLPAGFHAWSTGIEPVDQAILEKVGEPGVFPVRSVTTTELRSGRNRQKTVSTLEVSKLR